MAGGSSDVQRVQTYSFPSGYLQKLLAGGTGAVGFDQLQRSDLQLLLNARGKPTTGTREALVSRLQQAVSEEVPFKWVTLPHVAWAPKREWPALITHGDRLFMFGGRDEEEMLLVFKPTSGKFEPVDVNYRSDKFPTTLTCPSTLTHDGKLWVFGGRSTGESCTNDMYVYDFSTNALCAIKQHGAVPYPREGGSVVLFGDRMLLYGGVNSMDQSEEDKFEPRRQVMAFDFETRTWSAINTVGHMPGPRETVEAVAIHNNWMYTLAWNQEEGMIVYRLDVPKKKWSRVQQQGEVPPPRCEFAVAKLGSQWFIHGGYLRDESAGADAWLDDPVNETYIFDFDGHEWKIAITDVGLLARGQHAACAYQGSIVFAGGDVRRGRGSGPGGSGGGPVGNRAGGEGEGDDEDDEGVLALDDGIDDDDDDMDDDDDDLENCCDHVEAMLPLPCASQNSRFKAANCEASARLRRFYDSDAHSDVTLTCGGRSFRAHRLLLASQSATFDAMFQSGMKEGASGEVALDDMRPEVLEAFLKYMYGCQDDVITPSLVIDLFRAADHYQVESLRAECLDLMVSNIDCDNAAAFAVLADGHDLPDLLEVCVRFAAQPENITQVASSAAFLELMKGRPELAQRFTVGLLTGRMAAASSSSQHGGGNGKRKAGGSKPKRKRGGA